jgi:hypothetical protein
VPYIPPEERARLDPAIAQLAEELRDIANDPEHQGDYEGLLNYSITRLALGVIPERRYKHIARITGVLQNVGSEFYRRYVAPYEDEAAKKHGDVY